MPAVAGSRFAPAHRLTPLLALCCALALIAGLAGPAVAARPENPGRPAKPGPPDTAPGAPERPGPPAGSGGPTRPGPPDRTPPAAPASLDAVAGDGEVALSWQGSAEPDLAGYRLYQGGALLTDLAEGTTGTVARGLTNDTAYSFHLTAYDDAGNESAPSPQVSATPADLAPPAVPATPSAVAAHERVTLSWPANTEADLAGYRLYRDGQQVVELGADQTSHIDADLLNGTSFAYTLTAFDARGNESQPSAAVYATPVDQVPPGVPGGMTGTAGDQSAVLEWEAVTAVDLAYYEILQDGKVVAAPSAGTLRYDVTGLENDVSYAFAVRAVDLAGNASEPSAAVDVTPIDLTPPPVPTELTAVIGDGEVTLSWEASAAVDLAGYRVYRNGADPLDIAPGVTTLLVDGLTNGAAYEFTVTAYDARGNESAPSDGLSATPRDLTPPATPTGLTARAGDGEVTLGWDAVRDIDIAWYIVYRDGEAVSEVRVETREVVVSGLTNDTAYAFRVAAVDAVGNVSPVSAAVEATPVDLTPPAVPTGLTADAGHERVTLTWSASPDSDLTAYRVYQDGVAIDEVAAGTESVVVGDLENGRSYRFTVSAVDRRDNESEASAAIAATPVDLLAPGVPSGLTAVAGDGAAVLAWDAVTDPDLARYVVYLDGQRALDVAPGTTSVALTGLTNGVEHRVAVAAVDAAGNESARSADVVVVPQDRTPPATPSGLSAEAGDRAVTLSWAPGGEPDLAGYKVSQDGVVVAEVEAATVTVAGLDNGTAYAFAISAADEAGNVSPASAPVTATPVDLTPPVAPAGVVVEPGDGLVWVSWRPVGDAGTYRVYRDAAFVGEVTAGTLRYRVGDLVNDVEHTFSVTAVDAAGNESDPSEGVRRAARVAAVLDDFNRPDGAIGVAPVGALAWTAPGGGAAQWRVGGNQAYGAQPAVVDSGTADGTVSAVLAVHNTTTTSQRGLVFRVTDARNYWIARDGYRPSSCNSTWATQLVKVVDGVHQVAGTLCSGGGNGVTMTVSMSGSTIKLLTGGVQRLEVIDGFNAAATSHGLWSNDTGNRFDHFQIAR